MAEAIDDCAFWLPSHFLTDDDFLTDKQNFTRDSVKSSFRPDSLHLPMFGSSSALYSPGFSSETETDQDVLLAELTRKLAQTALQETRKLSISQTFSGYKAPEKSWVLGTSPQSTLAGVASWPKRSGSGSPNGPSQVPSEVQQDAWELIYAAAGQVARLKMNEQAQMNLQNRGSLQTPRNPSLVPKIPNVSGLYYNQSASYNLPDANQYGKVGHQVKQQSDTISVRQGREGWHCQRPMQSRWGCGGGCHSCGGGTALGLPQSAWPPLRVTEQQLHHRQVSQHQSGRDSAMRAVLLGASGPGLKRQSTGTGVFLPRRFGTTEPRKKPACSTVLLPARVAKALNMDLEEINPHHETASVAEHDLLTGGRNATCAEQRGLSMKAEGAMNHENRLPKDRIN
ncbi:hypothetical protein Nepgr_006082 [Nepenthes gracilis]|uniref:Uncharacterized protein n=1 Tax=Nepenthes gracilis TaxID=150966 RepID=A0AAD3XH26_NEPGR|nr:hypothetical protein Nepgr_006082 [Nepenthes gracilis]